MCWSSPASRSSGLQPSVRGAIPLVKMFAKALALGKVSHEPLGEEAFGPAVGGPLELLVALGHVFEEILHPEQRVLSIRHR